MTRVRRWFRAHQAAQTDAAIAQQPMRALRQRTAAVRPQSEQRAAAPPTHALSRLSVVRCASLRIPTTPTTPSPPTNEMNIGRLWGIPLWWVNVLGASLAEEHGAGLFRGAGQAYYSGVVLPPAAHMTNFTELP